MQTLRLGLILIGIALTGLAIIPTDRAFSISTTVQAESLNVSLASFRYQQINGCYNAQVVVMFNSTLSTSFTVQTTKIFLVETGTNITVTNSPNYIRANNTLRQFQVFPNLPVNLDIQFNGFCLLPTPGLQVWLVYDNPPVFETRII